MDKPFSNDQIKQNRRKKWLKMASVALLVLAALSVLLNGLGKSVDREDIRLAQVTRGDMQTSITAAGIVLPEYEETIASHIGSRVSQILVQSGQSVIAGQTLMQLDTTKLQLALEKDIETIALKDNQIKMLGHDLTQSVADLNGKMALLNVDLESRQTRYERLAKLADIGGASGHDLKEAQLDIKRTKIELKQLKQKVGNLEASTLTKIEGLQLEKSIAQKAMAETERLIAKADVKSPINGMVVWLHNEEGSAVTAGQALVKVADTSAFKISATLSDFYANQLHQGMKANFVYDDQTYQGELTSVVADTEEGGLDLMVRLSSGQSYDRLRQRLRVELNLVTNELKDILMIAKGPFIKAAGLQQVFVVSEGGAVRKEVNIGAAGSEYYQVKAGLRAGDQVIISDVKAFAQLQQFKVN